MKTVAVDFDGVLHEYSGWRGVDAFGDPLPGAKDFLKALRAKGYKIVIHSTRGYDAILEWFKKHKMLDSIDEIANQKPKAHAYVDDRAVRFNGKYDEVLEKIEDKPWWMKK